MKKIRPKVSLILLLTFANVSYAQDIDIFSVESISSSIFELITKIDDEINTFFQKEKANYLERNLGYFQDDLRKYIKVRKRISEKFEKNNYEKERIDLRGDADELNKSLEDLSRRLFDISSNISSELSTDAESIAKRILMALTSQELIYIPGLYAYSRGELIDKKKLIKEGKRIYKDLEASIELISKIRDKIKEKQKLN